MFKLQMLQQQKDEESRENQELRMQLQQFQQTQSFQHENLRRQVMHLQEENARLLTVTNFSGIGGTVDQSHVDEVQQLNQELVRRNEEL